jgi:hypothetical protein
MLASLPRTPVYLEYGTTGNFGGRIVGRIVERIVERIWMRKTKIGQAMYK